MWEYIFIVHRVGGTYAQKVKNKWLRHEIAPQVGAVKWLRKKPRIQSRQAPCQQQQGGPPPWQPRMHLKSLKSSLPHFC